MITTEMITINGTQYQRTSSDTHYIQKIGTDEVYGEAIDRLPCPFQYEESGVLLEEISEEVI